MTTIDHDAGGSGTERAGGTGDAGLEGFPGGHGWSPESGLKGQVYRPGGRNAARYFYRAINKPSYNT